MFLFQYYAIFLFTRSKHPSLFAADTYLGFASRIKNCINLMVKNLQYIFQNNYNNCEYCNQFTELCNVIIK